MPINEKIITGRKFRRLIDKEAKLWQRFSWWSKADDVEFDDGKTAEQKLGNINGITSILSNRNDIAASISSVNDVNEELQYRIGGFRIYRGEDGYIYIIDEEAGADSVPKKLGDGDPKTFDYTYDSSGNYFVFTEDTSYAYVLLNITASYVGNVIGKTLTLQFPNEESRSFSGEKSKDGTFNHEGNGFSFERIWRSDLNYADNVTFYVGLYLFKDIPEGTKICHEKQRIVVFK